MLNASLAVKNCEVAVLALGMGAPVSAVQLMELEGPGIDLAAEVETPRHAQRMGAAKRDLARQTILGPPRLLQTSLHHHPSEISVQATSPQ